MPDLAREILGCTDRELHSRAYRWFHGATLGPAPPPEGTPHYVSAYSQAVVRAHACDSTFGVHVEWLGLVA